MDRDISTLEELGAKWEADLHPDQKVYMLVIRAYVLPQLLAVTRERKEAADRTALNTVQKETNRAEMDQNTKEDIEEYNTLYINYHRISCVGGSQFTGLYKCRIERVVALRWRPLA